MRRNNGSRAGQRGSAFLLVVVLGTALLGIVGLALDGGTLYVTKQRAQAAADAAAEAGAMDLYRGYGTTAASASAVAYGVKNGFASSEVDPEYPTCSSLAWCNGHVTLSGDSPNLIQVTITKVVNTAFLRALGIDTTTVRAVATAAITVEPQPVPILVLHPTAPGSFAKNGSNTIQICGGPPRSIQVNSTSTTSISISGASGTVDLSHAGPLDTAGDCTAGTGADFGNAGIQNPYPGTLLLGVGQYISPASSITDPLLGVSAPAQPDPTSHPGGYTVYLPGQHGCPTDLPSSAECRLYHGGYYASGIQFGSTKVYAQFQPGIYWINHGGVNFDSNSIVRMAQGADSTDPTGITTWTQGMLVYNSPSSPVNTSNDIINITSNSGQLPGGYKHPSSDCPNGGNCLVGSPSGSAYKGILFFQNRATTTTLNHQMQGGGGLTISGTIYLTHTAASIQNDGKYQFLTLQGNSGGVTKVQGEIIVDELSLGGGANITMNLMSTSTFSVRQVALVQ